LKAEYEEQAKLHHLYPYITWDDLYNERTHHTYLPQWYIEREKERKKQFEQEKQQAQSSNK